MDRPTGVTLIAILGFIVGGLHFIGSFLAFASGSWLQAEAVSGYFIPAATPFVYSFGNLGFWIGMVGMIVAVIMLVAAGGLWVLSKFGWRLTIIALVLNLVLDVVHWLGGAFTIPSLLGAVVAVGMLIYLLRPEVKHAFDGFPIDAPTRIS
jgi:hypothetical protein